MADEPGHTSVATYDASGSNCRWLGALGSVTPAVYSYALPGGCDQLSCVLQREPTFRTDAMNPGRIVRAFRGGSCIWNGTLLEPTWSTNGWNITAIGSGNWGVNYSAIYSTWTNQNDAVNEAISRGLPWSNPGIPSGVWLGQQVDSGAQTIADLLNLYCTMGNYVWYVGRNNVLSVYQLPVTGGVLASGRAAPTRILTCTTPVPRTLGGDINVINIRYETSADGSSGAATYALTSVVDQASINQYGRLETYLDLSSVGVMSTSAAQAVGNNVLLQYQRAYFAGPFVVHFGEYLMPGGQPVDLGCEQAGQVAQLVMLDFGYGGEVIPDPVTFLVGGLQYDDSALTASITPYQYLDTSLSGLLGTLALSGGTAGAEQLNPTLAGTTS
jgi:hypothetical protein